MSRFAINGARIRDQSQPPDWFRVRSAVVTHPCSFVPYSSPALAIYRPSGRVVHLRASLDNEHRRTSNDPQVSAG
jgi:hypothetical protein